jgi:voltage-gated potassium channel Kch
VITYVLIGAALLAATVIVHGAGTIVLVRLLSPHTEELDRRPTMMQVLRVLIGSVVLLLILHLIEILLWAVAFLTLELGGDLATFEEAVYFSFVTYTTLGYGDITLSGPWRILSGFEALNGVLLAGWSTAILIAIVTRILETFRN